MNSWHRITNPDPNALVGDCSKCGVNVAIAKRQNGRYWACRAMINRSRDKTQRQSHGLTLHEARTYVAMIGCCEMCGAETALGVDHNHITGQVRGILCYRCNRDIVILDDPERLALGQAYLKFWKETADGNARLDLDRQ